MPSLATIHVASVVGITILLAAGCQSADQRQANELREFLRGLVTEIAPLNEKVLKEKRKLYEIDKNSPLANVDETRERYTTERTDLQRRVEEYPDLELTSLAQQIRTLIKRREQDAESAASRRRAAERHAEIQAMFKANAARDREALRPKIIQGGKSKTVE